jgi:hypothetical protein
MNGHGRQTGPIESRDEKEKSFVEIEAGRGKSRWSHGMKVKKDGRFVWDRVANAKTRPRLVVFRFDPVAGKEGSPGNVALP